MSETAILSRLTGGPVWQDPILPGAWFCDVPGESSLARWRQVRAQADQVGLWPVLLGPASPEWKFSPGPEEFAPVAPGHPPPLYFDDEEEFPYPPLAEVLAEAERLAATPGVWAEERHQQLLARLRELGVEPPRLPEPEPAAGPRPEPQPQPWWNDRPHTELQCARHWTGPHYPLVTMALLPVRHSWECPALLRFGNFNESPRPAQHMALLRHWHQRCGAEVVSMSDDTLELALSTPVQDLTLAWALAEEMVDYCPDRVAQGAGTLANLARSLVGSPLWFFWWD